MIQIFIFDTAAINVFAGTYLQINGNLEQVFCTPPPPTHSGIEPITRLSDRSDNGELLGLIISSNEILNHADSLTRFDRTQSKSDN